MQIYLHEVKILQIQNARSEFVKNIMAINQSESRYIMLGPENDKQKILFI
jgi:hypothetical protein